MMFMGVIERPATSILDLLRSRVRGGSGHAADITTVQG
jgi:hypothetical protein